ncbi:hypothetical protein PACTADRAFT_48287 [Pachysolen tannophilus NRRL Y-2460]|uniref:Ribosomal RNA-processing protein 43 n=1 Tax=Pachysolen tannophilus NRRL Y-2460 TaxID=669874 RepID=A0A1E4U3I8_PACTA|nr:hypothetical protein PACTADRAFT_48287 [Pachysolen tannophilus NRRL Y-2460]
MSEGNGQEEMGSIRFPAEILSVVAPDLSLKRHLDLGLRPCLRKFHEFKNLTLNVKSGLSRYDGDVDGESVTDSPVLGSSVIKSGNTTVICGITGGIVEIANVSTTTTSDDHDDSMEYTSIYPVVEISRGKLNGAPTDEEMILSQQLYETLLHSKILPKKSLIIDNIALKTNDDTNNNNNNRKRYAFVLYANIQVFSREGPLFDYCYGSLVKSLQTVKLPFIHFTDEEFIINDNRKNGGNVKPEIICDSEAYNQLKINEENINWSLTFGLVNNDDGKETIILCDLEGHAEETCCKSLINVIIDKNLKMRYLNIVGGDENVIIDENIVLKTVQLAKNRVNNILN